MKRQELGCEEMDGTIAHQLPLLVDLHPVVIREIASNSKLAGVPSSGPILSRTYLRITPTTRSGLF
jgi:hypothetical protein